MLGVGGGTLEDSRACENFSVELGIISELAPSVLMEVSTMDTPAQPLVRSQHIYAFALALVFMALVVSAILFLMIDF